MNCIKQPFPYVERCARLPPSGTFAIVWPFVNVARGGGPYELFLDTNALARTDWAGHIPAHERSLYCINPWPALVEQWLSNPALRNDPHPAARVEAMLGKLAAHGFQFRPSFASEQIALLRKNEAALRHQFSLIFPYVAIMKSLVSEKVPPVDALAKLDHVMQADVPRFTGLAMLLALCVQLKARQSLKLDGDSKPAYSYLDSFLSFQPGKKDECDYINVPCLRNRAGDLNLWLSVPTLRQAGYSFVGTPALITEDKALHRVILRTIPAVYTENHAVAFCVHPGELAADVCAKVVAAVTSVKVRGAMTPEVREERLRRLFELAAGLCARPEERVALEETLEKWCLPGMEEQFVL